MTINEFVKKHSITIECKKLFARTSGEMDEWNKTANHYQCKLKTADADGCFITEYSMGSALKGQPKVRDILNSIILDTTDGESFTDWCSNFGYETDSIKASKVYQSCLEQTLKAKEWLGSTLYQELMQCETL